MRPADRDSSAERPELASALERLGQRLGRDTTLYASASVGVFAFGLVNVAILTRLLSLEEFGEFALYLVLSALLTVLYNAGSLQGALLVAFGAADEGGETSTSTGSPGTTLATALAMTVVIAAIGTLALWALAAPLAELISGDSDESGRVLLAAAAGGLGSVWRLALNVPRYERRPGTFVALSTLRPLLSVSLSAALVAAGLGVDGALAGIAVGTLISALVAVAAARGAYALRPTNEAARAVGREGALFVPVVLGIWVTQNFDLYLLSAFEPSEVPLYRVASRIGAGISYFVAAFLMAWAPLYNSAWHVAAVKERGARVLGSRTLTYFVFASLWLVLALAVLSDILIRIAPEGYDAAASLIPLIGLGYVAYGLFVVIYRLEPFRAKRRIYAQLAVLAAVLFVLTSLVLIPPFGGHGAAASQIVAFSIVTVLLRAITRRHTAPAPIERRRFVGIVGAATVCLAASLAVGPSLGDWRIVADLLLLAAMPLLVVVSGAIPWDELRPLARLVRQLFTRARRRDPELRARLAELDTDAALSLRELVPNGRAPADAARCLGMSERSLLANAVRGLRQVEGLSVRSGDGDASLGSYLFSRAPVAERDRIAAALWAAGVDPAVASRLEGTIARLRRLPGQAFEADDAPASRGA